MKKRGFTLIEMLTVIVVLALLMGLVVKLFPNIARSSEKAITIKKLQATAYAINEYYAEYGTYPPVQSVTFALEDTDATEAAYADSIPYFTGDNLYHPTRKYGLLAYLVKCPMDGMDADYFGGRSVGEDWFSDTPADKSAKAKWAPFLEGIVSSGSGTNSVDVGGAEVPYLTKTRTIKDGWNREIRYESMPPYTSYKLWSRGRDGVSGNEDDIYVDQME